MGNFYAAVRAAMMLEGKLYNAIRTAYDREQFPENGDEIDKHAMGLVAAVNAVYNLGFSAGFTAGARYVRDGSPEIVSSNQPEKTEGENKQ